MAFGIVCLVRPKAIENPSWLRMGKCPRGSRLQSCSNYEQSTTIARRRGGMDLHSIGCEICKLINSVDGKLHFRAKNQECGCN